MSRMLCQQCGWEGEFQQTLVSEDGRLCPNCKAGAVPVGVERPAPQTVEEMSGAENLQSKFGDRFRGYYLFKKDKRTESLPLGRGDATYQFNIHEFEVKFVMPAKLEFNRGSIFYSEGERLFGMFRFPRDKEGRFSVPLSKFPTSKQLNTLEKKDIENILKAPKPLIFEAYRIPIHYFEYFDLNDADLQEIEKLTDKPFVDNLKIQYDGIFSKALDNIKIKIESEPNYLLILLKVLNREWTEFNEAAQYSKNIIHI